MLLTEFLNMVSTKEEVANAPSQHKFEHFYDRFLKRKLAQCGDDVMLCDDV